VKLEVTQGHSHVHSLDILLLKSYVTTGIQIQKTECFKHHLNKLKPKVTIEHF